MNSEKSAKKEPTKKKQVKNDLDQTTKSPIEASPDVLQGSKETKPAEVPIKTQSLPVVGADKYPKASFNFSQTDIPEYMRKNSKVPSMDDKNDVLNLSRRSSQWGLAKMVDTDNKVVQWYVPKNSVFEDKFEVNTLNEEEEEIMSFIMAVDVIRFLLLTANLFFGLSGLLFATQGVMYLLRSQDLVDTVLALRSSRGVGQVYGGDFVIPGCFFLAFGFSICITFFLGLYSICTNSRTRMLKFAMLLLLITIVQCAFVLVLQHPSMFKENSVKNLQETFMTNFNQDITFKDDQIDVTEHSLWTTFQLNFNCCGFAGPEDYKILSNASRTLWWRKTKKVLDVPLSCCSTRTPVEDIEVVVHSDFEDMQRCMKGEDDYFKEEGCFPVLDGVLRQLRRRILFSECIISCFNFYSIVFAVFDWWAMKVKKYVN